jgi:pimeloyl-ACP methyl ester carboxylesterase
VEWRGWPVHVERHGADADGDVDGDAERQHGAAPMVLLHGFGSGSFTWRPAIDAGLAEGRRAVAFDRFGFGRSARPRTGSWNTPDENPYSLTSAVALTAAVVDETLGDDADLQVVLVGHSAGALVASAFAATRPERIAALVLVAPAVVDAGPPPPVAAAFRLPGARQWGPPVLRAGRAFAGRAVATAWHDRKGLATSGLAADYTSATTADGWAEGLVELTLATAAAGPFDAEDALRRIRDNEIRTLVVAGASDRLVKPSSWQRVADATDAHVQVIDDAGHVPHEERPAAFVDAVRRFLAGVE